MILPDTPAGFKKRMTLHFNFGHGKNGGGVGVYEILDPGGNKMPFGWQYDTRKGGLTGFIVREVDGRVFTWAELREHYAKEILNASSKPAATQADARSGEQPSSS